MCGGRLPEGDAPVLPGSALQTEKEKEEKI